MLKKYSKVIVLLIILCAVIFWATETILLFKGTEGYPPYFIYSWYSFWGVELISLAGIKINDIRKIYKEPTDDEEING